jgi:hypothetical protein
VSSPNNSTNSHNTNSHINSNHNSGGANRQADQAGRRAGNRRRKAQKRPAANPEEFWGDPAKLPQEQPNLRIITDPAAIVRSLGRPPLSGHQNHAEGYFSAVYQRSVTLASVLAAAGDLIAPDDLVGDRPDL